MIKKEKLGDEFPCLQFEASYPHGGDICPYSSYVSYDYIFTNENNKNGTEF